MDTASLTKAKLQESMSDEEITELITSLSPKEAEALMYDWNFWARKDQLPPDGDWFGWLILCGRGWGKEERNSNKILTTCGWKTIGSLERGDFVFDEKGLPTKVLNTRPQGKKPVWRVHFSDHTYVDTGPEHRWVTYSHLERKAIFRKGSDFPSLDWANKDRILTREIADSLTYGSRGDNNHCIPLAKPLDLPAKPLATSPYLVGLWIGNGHSSSGEFTCHEDDKDLYEDAIRAAGFEVGVSRRDKEFSKAWRLSAKELWPCLRSQGFQGKNIPQAYLMGSFQERLALLRGLMDSDGYADQSHVEFCSMRQDHAEAVLWLARSLGEKPRRYEGEASYEGKVTGVKYRVVWKPQDPSTTPFLFARKSSAIRFCNNQQSRNKHRMILNVEVLEEEDEMTCIAVDSPNAMYLTGEALIPTSNTRTGSEWIIRRAREGEGPIALVGKTSADVRDTMIEVGESSIMRVCPPDFMPTYEPSKRRLTFPNGITCTTFTGQEPDQLRGPQHSTIWMDEPAKWDYAQECVEQAMYGLRIGNDPRFLATTTPRPIKIIKDWYLDSQLMKERDYSIHCTVGSTFDNSSNLAPTFIKQMQEKFEGTRMGEQELYGKILWESESAMWKQEEIDAYRVTPSEVPEMEATCISVDPTVGDPNAGRTQIKRDIDECGIMLQGRGVDQQGYLLGDYTMRGTPGQWASKVRSLLEVSGADFIVAEVNNGGLMVMETLKAHGVPEYKIILVRASQGKLVRAEPISLLGEQGKIHHVGDYPPLEQELVTYEGKGKSPNRLDAYVWGFTHLMGMERGTTLVKQGLFKKIRRGY